MQYRPLGNSGISASVLGLGTWVRGGGLVWTPDPDDHESIRTIQGALDAGINLIDTAPAYGWSRSEEIVGKAIFKSVADPDYQAILQTFDPVLAQLRERPRTDMVGAKPADVDRSSLGSLY